jgi:acid-sensing ion channel 5
MIEIDEQSSKNIKKEISSLLSTSSNHMVSKVFSNKRTILKLIWTIFGLISTIICIVFIGKTISEYLDYKVSTYYQFYNEKQSQFPAVTICNVNKFTTNEASVYLHEFLNVTSLKTISYNKLEPILFQTIPHILNTFTEDRKRKLGYSYEELVLKCRFNYAPCSKNDFTWFFDRLYGNCFTFNSLRSNNNDRQKIKNQNEFGIGAGLQMEMFAGIHDDLANTTKNQGNRK